MVFNNENFYFSTKIFSLKIESNNFSDITKCDKEYEFNYDENIDDNFTSSSTEFSSLSSITTTTSAYSSCSESSNCAPYYNKEFESNNEDEFSEIMESNLFYQQVSAFIDCHYDQKRKLIAEKVSNLTDLKLSKKFWNILSQKNIDNCLRQDFVSQIPKILLSITTLENELIKFVNEDFIFEHEFVLNLAFLLYENSERAIHLESNSNLIFEIDLNCQIEANFEKLLKFLVQKYVSKFIQLLTTQESSYFMSGKFWISLFKILLENETFTDLLESGSKIRNTDYLQYENFLDIEMFLSKPLIPSDNIEFKNSNPISQGYRELLDNLERLQYICNDPINDYETESELYGRVFHDRSRFFSYFSASYYTMGLFDLRKSLFDNPLQSIYENKLFNQEYLQIFKNDLISHEWKKKMIESLQLTPDEFSALFESVKSKQKSKEKKSQWDFEIKNSPKMSTVNKQENLKSIFEEIIERIETLNASILFNSYYRVIQSYPIEFAYEDSSPIKDKKIDNLQSNRKWTVAPKLFAKNTIVNSVKRTNLPCINRLNFTHELQKRYDEYSEIRGRSDLKPIGTKPASMFTISSLNRNRCQNKYFSVNNTINKEAWDNVGNVIN